MFITKQYSKCEFVVIRGSGFKVLDIILSDTIILQPTKFNFNSSNQPSNLLKSIFEEKAIYTHKGHPFVVEKKLSEDFSRLTLKIIKP